MIDLLTPEQVAQAIKDAKPYLVELDNHVTEVSYGEIDVKITARAGIVEKMVFYDAKTWLKEKA